MRLVRRWLFTLRSLFRGHALERELDEELQFHLEQQTTAQIETGSSPDAARRESLRLFGGVRRIAEECRESSGAALFDSVSQDVRYAANGLRRAPLFTGAVILLLGLGLGLNAAMFGIVDRVVLNGPAHVVDPATLRRVYETTDDPAAGRRTQSAQPYALYSAIRDNARTVQAVAGYAVTRVSIGTGLDSYSVPAVAVTADFLPMLGVRPELGRFFGAAEDDPSNPAAVVVLGDGLWRRAFGADRGIIGKTAELGTRRVTVIGVAPPNFTGVGRSPVDVWLSQSFQFAGYPADMRTTWNSAWLRIVVRRKGDVSDAQVDQDLASIARIGFAGSGRATVGLLERALPIDYSDAGTAPRELDVVKLLFAVAAIVLLIALANVTNLLLARAMRRRREVAVRIALGAGLARLARLFFVEGAMIAALASCVAVAIAWWSATLVRVWIFPDFDWSRSPVDLVLLAYLAAAGAIVGASLGVAPLRRIRLGDVNTALKSDAPQSGLNRSSARRWLQASQVALTAVLLTAAGAFILSLMRVKDVPLGMEPDRVLSVGINLPDPDSALKESPAARAARQANGARAILAAMANLPGVDAVAAGINNPFVSAAMYRLIVPGWDSLPSTAGGGPYVTAVTPDYFRTTGMHLLAGRAFGASDDSSRGPVAIINRTMANLLWPRASAIGRCFRVRSPTAACTTIVGVVEDARLSRVRDAPSMQYYVPMSQWWSGGTPQVLVRARADDPMTLVPTLLATLRVVAPSARAVAFRSWTDALEPEVHAWHVGSLLFGGFGLLALLVACVGLYSLAAYTVAQRTHEFGVRIALGASAGRILNLVLADGLGSVLGGALAGGVIALLSASMLQPLLFDTSAYDPRLYGAVLLVIIVTSLCASIIPSWRATRVDPLLALRAD